MQKLWPTNAAHGGSTTLTGAGSANDVFTFALAGRVYVQNDTAATIYVNAGSGTTAAATQGDEAVAAGAEFYSPEGDRSTWVSVYGVASTHVNGTATGGIVVYAEVD